MRLRSISGDSKPVVTKLIRDEAFFNEDLINSIASTPSGDKSAKKYVRARTQQQHFDKLKPPGPPRLIEGS